MTETWDGVPARNVGPELQGLAEELASVVHRLDLDVDALSGAEAAQLAETFARVSRLAGAGLTLAAGRVAASGYCREVGFDTAAGWLGDRTKASPWQASKTIETARCLAGPELAATREALVGGALTATQANEIATAAARAPSDQGRLLALAARETTTQLKAECRRMRLAARGNEDPRERRKRVVAEMGFGHRDLGDGLSELFARMPTSWMALVLAAVRQQCDAVFARARGEGREDPHQAYMVEALVTLLLFGDLRTTGAGGAGPGPFDAGEGGEGDEGEGEAGAGGSGDVDGDAGREAGPSGAGENNPVDHEAQASGDAGSGFDDAYAQLLGAIDGEVPPTPPPRRERRVEPGRCRCGGRVAPRAKIIVRVDQSALVRGHAVGGEVCDVTGVGPVPVATVRELWPDAVVKLVITKGTDVVHVTHLGRRATEAMVTAMQWASPVCSNITCDHERFVELDHRLGFANVGRTRLDELDGLCRGCHRLKSTENWQLVSGRGRRRFVPPEHPDHPGDPATRRWRGGGEEVGVGGPGTGAAARGATKGRWGGSRTAGRQGAGSRGNQTWVM